MTAQVILGSSAIAQIWVETQKTVSSERSDQAHFGYSLALEGNYALAAANREAVIEINGDTTFNVGAVYAYERNGAWSQVQRIITPDYMAGDQSGVSVAMSGNYAIIGASLHDFDAAGANPNSNAGAAYLYERDGNGTWNFTQKIVASDRGSLDRFGGFVSIDGNYALVGAYFDTHDALGQNPLQSAGSAYVFERNGLGEWIEVQKIVASDRGPNDIFGLGLSMSGNFAFVAASDESEDELGANTMLNSGSVYVFERDGNGNWGQVQKLVAPDRAAGDEFGSAVCVRGNRALVGARSEDEAAGGGSFEENAGSVYAFEFDGNEWVFVQKITASDRFAGDNFGHELSMDGDLAIIGARYQDEDVAGLNTMINAGSAYVFSRDLNGDWIETQQIVSSDRAAYDQFGHSVAISANNIFVGAILEDEDEFGGDSIYQSGSVYIFELSSPTGLAELESAENLIVYPNPAVETVTFELQNQLENGITALIVYDILGQEVLRQIEAQALQKVVVSLNPLKAGWYTCELRTKDGSSGIARFVKR